MSTFAYRATRVHADLQVEIGFTDARFDLADAHPRLHQQVALLAAACAATPALMTQVHGDDVAVVSHSTGPPVADALITHEPAVALVVRVADCVPVILADPAAQLVGAAHAGRRGLAAGIVPRAIERLRTLGAEDIEAWVGPHICGACYEVPESMRDEVAESAPEAWAESRWGTPALDIGAGVTAQLARAGVRMVSVGGCTFEDPRWPSFRRDGAISGRMAGVVWISSGVDR
jgi:YfiH family protein